MNPEIEDLIYFCTLFHNEKRDKEALETIKQLIEIDPHFDKVRRVLFQAIYKQVIDSMRNSLLTITSYYDSNVEANRSDRAAMLIEKKEELINKLIPLCKEAIAQIDESLLPNAVDVQMAVYFQKFKGDLYRYIAEYSDETDSVAAANSGEECYREALSVAAQNLPGCDPVRLSLILNAAVFRYEIRKEKDIATEMLTTTVNEIEGAPDMSPSSANETENVLSIMRENLRLWADCEDE
ncbi:DNA damage checkpoint protein rad25 [Tritrichomonas foetus]|uniref:DNA damage checkpoint protein rad25 n=1 Tax=Tritrichomonas foetus TaxID=1144522 RepID=A0A1J4JQY5_9EUKA|nr:DNA damage checkpoint protein rad25 [Tritrichomonas foetus]|eukprot:OHT01443.1 DNA damage checkpoint protein rad25 [Tritrichomonas foetus]